MGEIHERRVQLLGATTGKRGCGDTRRQRGITQTQLNISFIISTFVGATKLTPKTPIRLILYR